jgi:hypothetical protein
LTDGIAVAAGAIRMTDPKDATRDKRVKLALDAGAIVGSSSFVYGLYLIYHPLGPLVGGLLVALGCAFAGYDKLRRGDR